jgi:hypothetical protein
LKFLITASASGADSMINCRTTAPSTQLIQSLLVELVSFCTQPNGTHAGKNATKIRNRVLNNKTITMEHTFLAI